MHNDVFVCIVIVILENIATYMVCSCRASGKVSWERLFMQNGIFHAKCYAL